MGIGSVGLGTLTRGEREYLPWRREGGYTQKMKVGDDGLTLYLRTGDYPDGRLGEVFLDLAYEGSLMRAAFNCIAIAISVGLQHGVPLKKFTEQYLHTKFEPAGFVEGHDRIKFCQSIMDLVARDLAITYLGQEELASNVRAVGIDNPNTVVALDKIALGMVSQPTGDGCPACGSLMRRTGNCRYCTNEGCGYNEGCG